MGVRCRQIVAKDLGSLAEFLKAGFPERSLRYWTRALSRLSEHPTPSGMPTWGSLLESDGQLVGVCLAISSSTMEDTVKCNVSSWYVRPAFRFYASLLAEQGSRQDVTYLNVSPAAHTIANIEARGFQRYTTGQSIVPISPFGGGSKGWGLKIVDDPQAEPDALFDPYERRLLHTHAAYGCISLWVVTGGESYPFVFVPRMVRGFIPCARLVYCRSVETFLEFAKPLGFYLARYRRKVFVLIDSNGRMRGLGRSAYYQDGVNPRFWKGAVRPRVGDLSHTELSMFG
jgi:hypothetical protein